ncbi:MAG TPA: GAF domain-containing protein, partial [Solirubrobacteraceae bacterium]|nr:GAF domain-containing protein [Solirubrobacteraceae bacterium]
EEQAALRRVATLVARGGPPDEVFACVTEEVVRVLPVEFARMGRYESDETVTFVAASGGTDTLFPPGARLVLGGKNVSTLVAQTGRSARIDGYADASGPVGVAVREAGFRSAVGAPISVEGRLWGVMIVGSTLTESVPADTEARLAQFTELLATAVANAESRAGLARLAEEQAALRRVATLVAQDVPPEELFAAVAEEVVNVLPVQGARVGRYESDGTVTFVATTIEPGVAKPAAARLAAAGKNLALGGKNLATLVYQTGRPARLDSFDDASGPVAAGVREIVGGAAVGTPIVVEGRLWGVAIAGSTLDRRLPPDTEARLTDFTELLATAIANAESRAGLARLAEEQAALGRIATLVARRVPPNEVFAAVTEEVGRVLPVQLARMGRYELDGTITFVAASGMTDAFFPAGSRLSVGGKNVTTLVAHTGRPARIDGYADASGRIGDTLREIGIRSAVGAPINVEGRLWGVMAVASTVQQRLPAGTEARLTQFTELLATAVANAESRAGLARLAEVQAALRRVATLVAQGVPPEQLFDAVADEVAQVLPVMSARVCRYESDGTITFLAAAEPPGSLLPPGTRLKLGGKNLATLVFETGRPARLDDFATEASGPIGAAGRETPVGSAVGAPIVVESRLWGAVICGSKAGKPLPPDMEARLTDFTDLVAMAIANAQSRVALRPVERMRSLAEQITEHQLSGRLPESDAADEVAALGRTLNAMLDRVEAAVARERRVVSNASHELRTPLTTLRAEVDLALMGDRDKPELRAALESASEEARRMSRLADDLLVLARADQGRLPLRPRPLAARELLEHAADRARAATELRARAIVVGEVPDRCAVRADPDRAAQALDNLITNALRYGDGTITLSARSNDDHIELHVFDEGDGFPDELLPRAFERFGRG